MREKIKVHMKQLDNNNSSRWWSAIVNASESSEKSVGPLNFKENLGLKLHVKGYCRMIIIMTVIILIIKFEKLPGQSIYYLKYYPIS